MIKFWDITESHKRWIIGVGEINIFKNKLLSSNIPQSINIVQVKNLFICYNECDEDKVKGLSGHDALLEMRENDIRNLITRINAYVH